MELFETINQRYSYRGAFRDQPIPREDLRRIVQAGLQAPSGCNAQTTTFIVVDDPSLVRQIGSLHAKTISVQQARAFIVCVVDTKPTPVYEQLNFQVEDCAAAVENMLLAITALGYASVWIDGWLRVENRAETVGRLLKIPAGKIARILLPIGIPVEAGPRRDKLPFEQRAWFNTYGATK